MRTLSPAEITETVRLFRENMAVSEAFSKSMSLKSELARSRAIGNLFALSGQTTCGLAPEEVLPILRHLKEDEDPIIKGIVTTFLKETYPNFQVPTELAPEKPPAKGVWPFLRKR